MSERCPCGARIMYCDVIDMEDGKELFVYKCGICGSQVEFKIQADPRLY